MFELKEITEELNLYCKKTKNVPFIIDYIKYELLNTSGLD